MSIARFLLEFFEGFFARPGWLGSERSVEARQPGLARKFTKTRKKRANDFGMMNITLLFHKLELRGLS